MSMSFFPENLKLMSSVGAEERDAPAISVRNAAAAVALYAIASRDRCRLTGEWLRNAYAGTDPCRLSSFRLNARGVWCVGWSRTVGGGVLWWAVAVGRSGCIGGQRNWEPGTGDKCGRGDVGGGGRGVQRRSRMVRRW